jgi:3-deoxy-D-manno-octulosonic-acid transferase
MAPTSLVAYRLVTRALGPFTGPLLSWRRARGKEDEARLGERRGFASLPRPPGPLVWLHGASVGEALSLLPLVERLAQAGRSTLVTTGTVTSARLLAKRLPGGAMHQYAPLDAPQFMRRFIAHWRPDVALIAESELWPNMIVERA